MLLSPPLLLQLLLPPLMLACQRAAPTQRSTCSAAGCSCCRTFLRCLVPEGEGHGHVLLAEEWRQHQEGLRAAEGLAVGRLVALRQARQVTAGLQGYKGTTS
jgi:hypothetical protein